MGTTFTVSESYRKEIILDFDEIVENFEDDWRVAQADGLSEDSFLRELLDDIGLDELEMGLINAKVIEDGYLEVINEG